MSNVTPFQLCALIVFVVMTLLWEWQRRTQNATLVDVAWAYGVGLVTLVLALTSDGEPARRLTLGLIVALWSLRLGTYLLKTRVLTHSHEDGRYARLRQEWSQVKFYIFYLAQGALILLLPFSLKGAMESPAPFPSLLDVIGLTLWVISWVGESIADAQLSRHRKDPTNRGKTCRSGLWKYSRHPNYFFEWLIWCSYLPLAWSAGGNWAFALIGPTLLAVLFAFVSGIPPTEAQALASRGDDYREYQRTTSAFFPWFPKK